VSENFELYNQSVYFPDLDICVLSDLHLGLEDVLHNQRIHFPFNEEEIIIDKLKKILRRFNPNYIFFNGDVLHSFEYIPDSVPKKIDRIISACGEDRCKFINGSHDTMLPYILQDRGYDVHDKLTIKDFVFYHGEKKVENRKCDFTIIGHDHPSIDILGQKFKCYLLSPEEKLMVLPAFSPLCEGTSINEMQSEDFMSPILKEININDFKVFVEAENEIFEFPKLGSFKDKL